MPELPTFVAENLFWEWHAGDPFFSDWHEVNPPTAEGQIRMVNRQIKCWRSARHGAPPTIYGEIFNPDDYA